MIDYEKEGIPIGTFWDEYEPCDPYEEDCVMTRILNQGIKNGFLYNVLTNQDTEDIISSERFLKCFFKFDGVITYSDGSQQTILEHRIEKMNEYEFPQDYLEQFLD
ncbi:MAG: hypothetical protein R6W66_09805 [Pelovirga sp.]